MRMTKVLAGATMALGLAVAGCGDSGTGAGASTVTITNAEALEMWGAVQDALSAASFSASKAGGPSLSRVSLPELNKQVNISVSANCPSGGSAAVSGSDDATASGGTFDFTLSMNSCKTTHFTLGGSLEYKGNITVSQSSFDFSLTVTGNVTVSATDGRSGTCGFDFTVTESGTLQAPTITVSGTICGLQANGVITAENAA